MEWQHNLLETDAAIRTMLATIRRVAVLGMRSEQHPEMPAFYVAQSLVAAGLEVVPVPVYEKTATHMLGLPVYRRLVDVPPPIDLVDVFRLPFDIPKHVDDMLAARPAVVWFQRGIRHDAVAETLARAGIQVVQDRCLMVEYQRWLGDRH